LIPGFRPKEIQMCEVFPTLGRLAKTACLPASQKIELFSGNAPAGNWGSGNFFLFLLTLFRLRPPMETSFCFGVTCEPPGIIYGQVPISPFLDNFRIADEPGVIELRSNRAGRVRPATSRL
jgi:hypothetical protein